MRVGERRSVPLKASATAGYRWFASVDGGAVAVELRRGELPPGSRPGLSVPEEAELRAVAEGTARVRLEQRRPWESADRVAEVVEIEVRVEGPGRA